MRLNMSAIWFAGALLFCALFAAGTWLSSRRPPNATQFISNSYNALFEMERLLSASEQAESFLTNYESSHHLSDLLACRQSSQSVADALDRLRTLTGDNHRQQANLENLSRMVASQQALLQSSQKSQSSSFQPRPTVELGTKILQQVRAQVRVMENEEQGLLAERLMSAQQASQRASLKFSLGALVSALFLVLIFIKLNREIRKRVNAEYHMRLAYSALDVGNRHLNGILESTADFIAAVDLNLDWIALNAKYSAQFRQRYGAVPQPGMSLHSALAAHPEEFEKVSRLWLRALAGETFSITEERQDVQASTRFYEIRYYPIADRCGTPIAACQIARDITERKHFESILFRQSEELTRSNAELEQFAYAASHDLQEPLRMVSSYMQLLAERYQGKLDARADKYIGYAVDGAQRMQALINDLLALSRVNSRGTEFKPTNCEEILERVLHDLQTCIGKSQAVVEYDELPVLLADEGQLSQLFQNLIGNAIKFQADRPPHIRIWAEPQAEQWLFSVQDNGIGIAPEYSDRIFVLFQRLHSRQEYSGTGIGLAICKKIVERHGGRIWVESQPDKGSIFKFTLPLSQVGSAHANWQEVVATYA